MREHVGITRGQAVRSARTSTRKAIMVSTYLYAKLSGQWLNRVQTVPVISRLSAAFAHQKYPGFQMQPATYAQFPQDL